MPVCEVDVEEVEYLCHGDQSYLARIYRPRGPGPFASVVEAHGGAWSEGDRTNNDVINRRIAAGGIVVAAVDFRNAPVAAYPGSVADINFAIRWLKSRARDFSSGPELVGAMGTSSGGHLVVLNGLKPLDPRYASLKPINMGLDARVPYVVALWPVICPIGRYRYLQAKSEPDQFYQGRGGTLELQKSYWLTEEAMEEGSPTQALIRGDAVELPNILVVQNESDELHPRANLDQFVANYRRRGGTVDVELYTGGSYDMLRRTPDVPDAQRAFEKIISFIHEQAFSKSAVALR